MSNDYVFTSESVCAGHPDKLCDQVSDAIVDRFLRQDPSAHLVSECAIASGVLFIACHYASGAKLDISQVARDVLCEAGYPPAVFDAATCAIMSAVQALDVAPFAGELGALSDSRLDSVTATHHATLFGYACDQSEVLMPLPVWLAHRLVQRMDSVEVRKALPYLLPDGRSQVGIEYRDGKPWALHSLTLVASHAREAAPDQTALRRDLIEQVVEPVLHDQPLGTGTRIDINPEGPLIGGGPATHAGLTGRKTGVDTYGDYARHGSAALSGKGPLRVDRVGAYAARYLAKNVVAAGLAHECEVQLCYAIGQPGPVSLRVRTFDTASLSDETLARRLWHFTDLRLGAIVRDFGLQTLPAARGGDFYRRLAVYGHMGREDLNAPWEDTTRAEAIATD